MTASLKQLLSLLLVGTVILGNDVLVKAFTYSHSVRQSSVRCRSSELFGFDWKKNPFTSAFSFGTNTQREDDDVINEAARRMTLKQELLERCRLPESKDKRAQIEETIKALASLNPTSDAATNPRLQKQWDLVWTTEKEINFFLEKGWATEIGQTLNDAVLQNTIPFVNGGSLGVQGTIQPDPTNPLRTNFEFESATLDLAKWGSYNLPPIGKGWFDTIYLDDELRVDENSRNDILICIQKKKP